MKNVGFFSFLLIFSVFTASCTWFKQDEATTLPANCPPQKTVCITLFAPAVCSATEYDGKPLQENEIITGKGSNSCRARQLLADLACAQKKDPMKLGKIDCKMSEMSESK